jgi:hypothetical protein
MGFIDDKTNKAGSLICADARFFFGFAGLASAGEFKASKWILETLFSSGPGDYTAWNTLYRFTERATKDFNELSALKNLSKVDKRFSVIFSGYIDLHNPPLAVCVIVTNFQNALNGIDSSEAWDNFQIFHTQEKKSRAESFDFVNRIGMWPAMTDNDVISLRLLLSERKPARAIIDKGVELVRSMADRPSAHKTIGKQITSICLPRDIKKQISVDYHTDKVTHESKLPSQVISISDSEHLIMMEPILKVQNSDGTPGVFVPKVSRNAMCPCKSGKKYKYCHGK